VPSSGKPACPPSERSPVSPSSRRRPTRPDPAGTVEAAEPPSAVAEWTDEPITDEDDAPIGRYHYEPTGDGFHATALFPTSSCSPKPTAIAASRPSCPSSRSKGEYAAPKNTRGSPGIGRPSRTCASRPRPLRPTTASTVAATSGAGRSKASSRCKPTRIPPLGRHTESPPTSGAETRSKRSSTEPAGGSPRCDRSGEREGTRSRRVATVIAETHEYRDGQPPIARGTGGRECCPQAPLLGLEPRRTALAGAYLLGLIAMFLASYVGARVPITPFAPTDVGAGYAQPARHRAGDGDDAARAVVLCGLERRPVAVVRSTPPRSPSATSWPAAYVLDLDLAVALTVGARVQQGTRTPRHGRSAGGVGSILAGRHHEDRLVFVTAIATVAAVGIGRFVGTPVLRARWYAPMGVVWLVTAAVLGSYWLNWARSAWHTLPTGAP